MNELVKMYCLTVCFLIVCAIVPIAPLENKYSEKANTKANIQDYKQLNKPFRMAKINSVWEKAQKKLSEGKLKNLYPELQLQDKEELQLKKLKAEGSDKEGLKEAEIRKKFKGILNKFGLSENFEEEAHSGRPAQDRSDNHINKSLFKDKKLNKLWEKAERAGFSEKELKTLKEEFSHHQDKLDEYYMFMESLTNEDKNLMKNDIPDINTLLEESEEPAALGNKQQGSKLNHIRDKHQAIKESLDKLHKKTSSGPNSSDFSEPRVQNLWNIALKADFSPAELNSLRTELKHYEKRLEKLQQLQGEFAIKSDFKAKDNLLHTDKDTNSIFEEKIKRQARTVDKLHLELEERIMRRHTEL